MRAAVAAACLAAALPAVALDYTEGADLSGDWRAPTPFVLDAGANRFRGTMGFEAANRFDVDYFAVTVPAGLQLQALRLLPGTVPGGGASFLGLQAGGAFGVDPQTLSSGASLLGWVLYDSADIGTNVLTRMGAGPDKIGFAGALPAGAYSLWVQELTPRLFPDEPYPPYPYALELVVGAVPEPGAGLLGAAGLAFVAGVLRRRRSGR